MPLVRLPASASVEEAVACVKEHGYVIIEELASRAEMDRAQAELAPYIDNTRWGESEVTGRFTRRTGSLVARSPGARELLLHPLVLGTVEGCLSAPRSFQLSLTEVISLSPGAPAQFIHRDTAAPVADDYETQISTLWAMTDYTEDMGATRIVPGSHHLAAGRKFTIADTIAATMQRGSILMYSSKLYHGGGQNISSHTRQAMNVNYIVGWMRQEENQYLSCPREVARSLPEALLRLMGYDTYMSIGRIGDWEDPLQFALGKRAPLEEERMFAGLE